MLFLLTIGLDEAERQLITEIYYTYRTTMKMVALSYVRHESVADDIIQDAFFRIRNQLDKIYKLTCNKRRAYIVNIVKHLSIDYLRKAKRENEKSQSADHMIFEIRSKDKPVGARIELEELRLRVSDAMLKLSKQDYEILKARYYDELSMKEIGEKFDIATEGTVRSKLLRARKRMLAELIYGEHGWERIK